MDKNEWTKKVIEIYVLRQLKEVTDEFPVFVGGNEAYAVILEELNDYFDLLKNKEPDECDRLRSRLEKVEQLSKVAAMAIKAAVDLYI